jgi:asparagine synthase (glutamine-hydrolysing)
MSVQFGRWNFDGQPCAPEFIEKVSASLAPYGPDSNESYSKGGVKILYRAFHTTKESRRETQPHISLSGAVITWDGRLDNRAELISDLRDSLTISSTDVAIVAAAYEKWGADCLAKLIGDWAVSIWNPVRRSLILGTDPIGTRHLYYSFDNNQVTWSTILEPLVLLAGKTFALNEEYIAGWFAIQFPAAHLTPYVGIHAVPPSSSVQLWPGGHNVSKYWDFDPGKGIRYRTDAEYEEQFRSVLFTAVRRRLRSDRPVLAELSGGMDSSSIVCMADTVITRGVAETPRLDTISWFDDSYDHLEPDTNEFHWITKVEEKRARSGHHINLRELRANGVGSQKPFESGFDEDRFAVTPDSNKHLPELFKQYAAYMKSQGHCVALSGIGGDEATGGGVPTPTPELQNLLARARLVTLSRQLSAWAAKMRKPRLPLFWEAVRGFFSARVDVPKEMRLASWFDPGFVRRNRAALCGYPSRMKLFGSLPSFQDHIDKLETNRRFVAYCDLHSELLRDLRYPYFDRDFLEFMYAIPREQIVRVGQRRSLMKRSLVGIVPNELLNRRRKAFAWPESPKDSSAEWPSLVQMGQQIISSSIGIVDPDRFPEVLQKARRNEDVPIHSLNRTLTLEFWLRHLTVQGVLTNPTLTKKLNYYSRHSERGEESVCMSLETQERPTHAQPKVSAS